MAKQAGIVRITSRLYSEFLPLGRGRERLQEKKEFNVKYEKQLYIGILDFVTDTRLRQEHMQKIVEDVLNQKLHANSRGYHSVVH